MGYVYVHKPKERKKGSCGNDREGKAKADEKLPQVIDPRESTWNEIMRMGNPHIATGENGDGSGGKAAAAAPNEGKGEKGSQK